MQELSSVYYCWKGRAKKYSTTNTYDHPFQIIGVDNGTFAYSPRKQIFTSFQDLFTKWPLAFPAPDQKLNELCDCLMNR